MISLNSVYAKTLILVGLLVYCFLFQGARGLYERDEGRYTDVANQMIVLGDFVKPHLDRDDMHWTKPPLTYWAIAGSLELFGHNEFAARFPGALSFFFTILLVYGMARVLLERQAWIAPLIYGTSLFPFAASNAVSTDDLLNLWLTAAVFAFVKAVWGVEEQKGSSRDMWMFVMWGMLALAFLTKGPVGLLPLIVIVLYLWLRPEPTGIGKMSWLFGVGIFLLIAVPWFAAIIYQYPELLDRFVVDETIARVAGKHHRNAQWYGAIVIYGPVLLLGTLPWTYWILRDGYYGVRAMIRRGRGSIAALNDQTRFLLLWFVCPLVIFSLIRSRLPLYILPAFAPISLLLAQRLSVSRSFWTPRRAGLIGVWVILLLLVRVGAAYIPNKADARDAALAFKVIPKDQYDEIVFYDLVPQYGLSFYLAKDVARADSDTAIDELKETEKRVWVVDPAKRTELEDLVKRDSGKTLSQVGQLQSKYLILQERS